MTVSTNINDMDITKNDRFYQDRPRLLFFFPGTYPLEADLMETLHHSLMANADQRCTALLESLDECPDGEATCHSPWPGV